MIISFAAFRTIILFGSLTLLGDDSQVLRVDLSDPLAKNPVAATGAVLDPLGRVQSFAELRTKQPANSDGIYVLIHLLNEGDTPIQLFDPPGTVSVWITDEAGRRIDLPEQPHEVLICRPEGTPPEVIERLKQERRLRQSFDVILPTAIGKIPGQKTPEDIRGWTVELAPGERFSMELRIRRVLADPNEYPREIPVVDQSEPGKFVVTTARPRRGEDPSAPGAPRDPRRVPIGAGTYQFKISLSLSQPDSQQPGSLRIVDGVKVQFGSP